MIPLGTQRYAASREYCSNLGGLFPYPSKPGVKPKTEWSRSLWKDGEKAAFSESTLGSEPSSKKG